MAKTRVKLREGKGEVHPAKLKSSTPPPLDRTPRCELCVHYYRRDLKKKRRGEPLSCHDLNCEPHDHCKLFQRLPEPLTQSMAITTQRLDARAVDLLEALLLDRRKQIVDTTKRRIREMMKVGSVWVYWLDPEHQKRCSAKVEKLSSGVVMLVPQEGKKLPERIRVLEIVEYLSGKERKARLAQPSTVTDREPPSTRRSKPKTK